MESSIKRRLNWLYAALLISLIFLGWLIVRSGIDLVSPDGSYTVCYSCYESDVDLFEVGEYIFAGLLLLRLLRWTKGVSQMELIAALLCWLCVAFLLLRLDVASIILTIRLGNKPLLAWMVCYLAVAPVLIFLWFTRGAEPNEE
jgi:hypothetical protein